MKKKKPRRRAPERTSSGAPKTRVMEMGYPFFIHSARKRKYSSFLRRYLQRERFFQGTKEVRWKPAEHTDYSQLHGPATDMGLIASTNLGAPAYYGRKGLLLPLEGVFPDYSHYFLEAGWRKGLVGKHLYSVPQHASIRMLFYRKDLLRKYAFEPPLTWMEMVEQATAILRGEKDPDLNGFAINFNPNVCFSVLMDYIWTQGLDLYEKTADWVLNRKALETALKLVASFFEKGLTPKSVKGWDYLNAYSEFFEGHSVFLHHWSDGIQMIHELPPLERENFGWCPIPTFNLKTPSKAMVGGLNYIIPQNTRYPEAAAGFLKRIMREDFQCWYAENLGSPYPGVKNVYLDAKVRRARPYLDQAEFFLRHGKLMEDSEYFQGDYIDWTTIGGQELTLFLEGTHSPQEIIDRMERRFADLLPHPLYSGLTAQAVNFIQGNLEKSLKVGNIARQLKVSPEHFIRVFSQSTGQTPLQFINDAKMEKAKALLKKGDLTVGEVAYSLGFKSRDHFSRLFHQLVKHTPNEYRK
jgi:AraC-like DNA-binding protein/maltose-binding protein MalE